MALPVAVTGIKGAPSDRAGLGPFISSSGNVYFVAVRDDAGNDRLSVQKATDPTSSFTEADTVLGAGSSIVIQAVGAHQEGDLIHIGWMQDAGGTVTPYYSQFKMATDLFADNTDGFGLSVGGIVSLLTYSDAPTTYGVDVTVRSDGDIIVAYHGENPRDMGGNFQEIAYSRWEGSSWTHGVVVASTGAKDDPYLSPRLVIGSTDQAFFFYNRPNANQLHTRGLSSANALRTQRDVVTYANGIPGYAFVLPDRGGSERVCKHYHASTAPSVASFDYFDDDSTLGTVATDVIVTPNSAVVATGAFDDGDTNDPIFVAFQRSASEEIDLYTDGGTAGTFSSEATSINQRTNTSLSAQIISNIFTRGSNVVFAFVYDDNGTLYYDEYVIRSSGPTTITGTGALTSAAATLSGSGSVFATVSGTGGLLGSPATVAGSGDIFGNIDGSGAIIAGAGQVAGDGQIARIGTGALDAPSPYTVSGVGGPVKTGTGSLVAGSAQVDGLGDIIKVGSGALQAGAGQIAGDGSIVKTGSGALQAGAGQVAGSGNLTKTGSGALTGPSPYAVAGVGGPVKTGQGAIIAAPATLSGLGDIIKTASGALQAAAATLSGDGSVVKVGSGALQAGAATVSGDGAIIKVGSGALQGPAGEVDGSGGVTVLVTGDGSLISPAPSLLSGVGEIIKTGSGDLVVAPATLSGLGEIIKTGQGALIAVAAEVAGAGQIARVGSGALQAASGQVAGSGAIGREGSGAITAPAGEVAGGGGISGQVSGVGDVIAPSGQVQGDGFTSRVGSGSIIAPSGQVASDGTIIKTASGALQAASGQISGAGSSGALIAGSGAILAGAGLVSGAGTLQRFGSGALVAQGATLDGSGAVGAVTVGTGALIAPGTLISGIATRSVVGDGVLIAPGATLSGIAVRSITGSGTLTAAAALVLGFEDVPIIGVVITGLPVAPVVLTGAPSAAQIVTGAPSGVVSIIGGGQVATKQDVDQFSEGEDIVIELFAKDEDGVALASPADETIQLSVAKAFGGAAVLTVDTTPQVVLADAGAAQWTITLDKANDLDGVITPGVAYQYSIHSTNGTTGKRFEQARGRLFWLKGIGPFA